ncbi:CDGSH iron-sulfur domain-containing protein [Candidatus Leptofilum sp.]|uniref:CDGSH iron-sulfur domain-containing protein n=1 Tax=Candidatus Leptofilum sp. TaxID=3241576 RepID=UPI003B596327
MSKNLKQYTSEKIDVSYDVKRCIHAAECVRGLPAVFDTAKRPWVQPGNSAADAVVDVVERCPTGALHYTRKDDGLAEKAPEQNRILITPNGPLYVHGDLQIEMADNAVAETRAALCRCGQSANKPFCDNAHKTAEFTDAGHIAQNSEADVDPTGLLTITPAKNGPILLRGNFELVSADGQTLFHGEKAALCRCGASSNKPFCDGSHKAINFTTEAAE